jgi:hypothetical protein
VFGKEPRRSRSSRRATAGCVSLISSFSSEKYFRVLKESFDILEDAPVPELTSLVKLLLRVSATLRRILGDSSAQLA